MLHILKVVVRILTKDPIRPTTKFDLTNEEFDLHFSNQQERRHFRISLKRELK